MNTGIALFVYNRPEHTRLVLDGLKQNNIKKLYIFADGIKDSSYQEKVMKVRKIISDIDWCETEIVASDINKGLAESIVYGVNYVLERHERVIVLEDDCVPSNDFIEFMESCFDKYENDFRVMNVSGYSLPITIPEDYPYDIYFCKRSSSWGWGTWRRAWKFFDRDYNKMSGLLRTSEFKDKVDNIGPDLIPMLIDNILGKVNSWSIFWSLNIIQNDGICINPINSKINNIGFDGTGVHCGRDSRYKSNIKSEAKKTTINFPPDIILDTRIIKAYRDFFDHSEENILQRYKQYYTLFNTWIKNLHNFKDVVKYFNREKIESISIYGLGELGLRLYEEVEKNTINIDYIIDNSRSTEGNFNNIPIIALDQVTNINSQAIIVTPIYDYDNIKTLLREKNYHGKIISLQTIINEVSNID